MNLGDELRATLNQEADMQMTTGPDVNRLIIGGAYAAAGATSRVPSAAPSPPSSSAVVPTR